MGQEREARKEDINRKDGKLGDGGIRHSKRKRGGWWSLCAVTSSQTVTKTWGVSRLLKWLRAMLLSAPQRVYGGIVWERLASEMRTFRGNEEQSRSSLKKCATTQGYTKTTRRWVEFLALLFVPLSWCLSVCLSVSLSVVHQRSRRVKWKVQADTAPCPLLSEPLPARL